MGVYTLAFAQLFLGEPDAVAAVAARSDAGIDLDVAVSLGYSTGAVASLTASMSGPTPRSASVTTDRGRFDLPESFHHPAQVTWTSGLTVETVQEPVIGTGLAHEASEVIRCLRNGETESPLVPLDDTVAVMRLMDRIRAQVGVAYAADRSGDSG